MQLIWTLMKKNLRHGYGSGSLILIALGLTFAWFIRDVRGSQLSEMAWLCAIMIGAIAGVASAAAFNSDLQKEGIRFLEYLPVRPIHIWAANYLDGLIAVVLAAIGAIGFKAMTADLNEVELFGHASRAGIASASDLIALVLLVGVVVYAAGSFARLAAGRRIVFGSIFAWIVLALELTFVDWSGLTPTASETAPIALLLSILFTIAGVVVFVRFPPHRTRWPVRLGVASFTGIAILGAVFLVESIVFTRWAKLSPEETKQVDSLALPMAGPWVIEGKVTGSLSGSHGMSIDLASGKFKVLGRDPMFTVEVGVDEKHPPADLYVLTRFPEDATFRRNEALVRVSLETGEQVRLTSVNTDENGEFVSRQRFTVDRRHRRLIWAESRFDKKHTEAERFEVVIADLDARPLRRIPTTAYADFWVAPNGKILTSDQTLVKRWAIFDPETNAITTIDQNPAVIRFDENLERALILGTGTEMSIVDLATRKQHLAIHSEDMPELNPPPPGAGRSWPNPKFGFNSFVWRGATPVHVGAYDERPELPCDFDAALKRALCVARKRSGFTVGFSAIAYDLEKGTHETIAGEEIHPNFPIDQVPSPAVLGLSRDGASGAYSIGEATYRIDLDHRSTHMVLGPARSASNTIVFSPSLRWVFRSGFVETANVPRARKVTVLGPVGEEKTLIKAGPLTADPIWLDDTRLAIADRDGIRIFDVESNESRTIWSAHTP